MIKRKDKAISDGSVNSNENFSSAKRYIRHILIVICHVWWVTNGLDIAVTDPSLNYFEVNVDVVYI
jgi:hypothetical protein